MTPDEGPSGRLCEPFRIGIEQIPDTRIRAGRRSCSLRLGVGDLLVVNPGAGCRLSLSAAAWVRFTWPGVILSALESAGAKPGAANTCRRLAAAGKDPDSEPLPPSPRDES
jgi:hypothetical protein